MYPQDLLAASSYEPSSAGFLPGLRKRPATTGAFSFPQQQSELLSDLSDDDQASAGSLKRFKPSSPSPSSTSSSSYSSKSPASSEPAMTPSRHKTTTSSSLTTTRPNMSASHSITLEMLKPHFETPLAQVAKQFGICVTLLKKICRKHGISRWPHRQITGLRKSISSMEHAIGYFEGVRRESYAEQLRKQKTKLALLLEDPTKCSPLPVASRLMGQQQYQQHQFENHQDEHYQTSVTSSPASSSSFPSPQQLNRSAAFPVMSQTYLTHQHQQLFTPVDHMSQHQQLKYTRPASPETFFPTPGGFLPLPRPQQQPQQQFYLPPLRTEPRRMLPPIASLVAGNASW